MKPKFLLGCLVALTFVSFMSSCDWGKIKNDDTRTRGAIAGNVPSWATWGVSKWKDWQGSEGVALHRFVRDDVISDDYQGKFRIIKAGVQDISLCFNDPDGTAVVIIYNWYAELKGTTNLNVDFLPQDHPDSEFVFSCHAKQSLMEEATESNRSDVRITRYDKTDQEAMCHYSQTIGGEKIIDTDLYGYDYTIKLKYHSWLPWSAKDSTSGVTIFTTALNKPNSCPDTLYYFALSWGGSMCYNADNIKRDRGYFFSYEGVTERECDDVNQVISYNFLDAKESGSIDYMELKRNGNVGSIYLYHLVDSVPHVYKAYDNLIME